MNKNILVIAVAIVVVGAGFVGAMVYIHNSDIQLEREKQQKIDQDKKDAEEKAQQEASAKNLQYLNCKFAASSEKDSALKANSQYETKDENGGVIYHGNQAIFNQIEQSYQQSLTRCSTAYQ